MIFLPTVPTPSVVFIALVFPAIVAMALLVKVHITIKRKKKHKLLIPRPIFLIVQFHFSFTHFHRITFLGNRLMLLIISDINECDDPALAGRCVENAECCNLPANFLCKCKTGFVGNGEVHCDDIDECQLVDSCGANAICQNSFGNFTCTCQQGYTGNPYDNVSFNITYNFLLIFYILIISKLFCIYF